MHPEKSLAISLALLGAVLAHPAAQGASIRGPSVVVPATPLAFEAVNLRMTIDACEFSPSGVVVKTVADAIQVQVSEVVACSPPGALAEADVRLGAYPAGTYNVEVVSIVPSVSGAQTVLERLHFTVNPRNEIPVGAARNFPLTDYTGLWWNEQESGWGLSIHQGIRNALLGTLFVYDAQNRAQWFTIQPGGWTSSTRWEGPLYRTSGPHFAGPIFDPGLVLVKSAGSAVIEFTPGPAGTTRARFVYTVDGVTTVKTLTRMMF